MSNHKIREVMTSNLISVSPKQTLQEAAALMSQYNIGSVPVVENGQLRGILTDRDITLRSTAQGLDAQTSVSQCMTTNLVVGNPNMDVHEATNIMAQGQIRRLPIIENNHMVGIVALGDLATKEMFRNEAGQALSSISIPSEPQ